MYKSTAYAEKGNLKKYNKVYSIIYKFDTSCGYNMLVRDIMGTNEGKQLKYFQLMEDLKAKILTGEIQAGDKLPSENELSAQYKISRQTVRKALSMLQNAGYIYMQNMGEEHFVRR